MNRKRPEEYSTARIEETLESLKGQNSCSRTDLFFHFRLFSTERNKIFTIVLGILVRYKSYKAVELFQFGFRASFMWPTKPRFHAVATRPLRRHL